jgi:hypothetical protein
MPAPPYKMWEILERARTGPFCEDDAFTMERFMPKMQEVIEKYGIRYDPATPIPSDDALADAVWQAGLEFFLEVGVLCVDTHRILTFDEGELREALYLIPGEYPASVHRLLEGAAGRRILRSHPRREHGAQDQGQDAHGAGGEHRTRHESP